MLTACEIPWAHPANGLGSGTCSARSPPEAATSMAYAR